jgi:hypothetical protein
MAWFKPVSGPCQAKATPFRRGTVDKQGQFLHAVLVGVAPSNTTRIELISNIDRQERIRL